MIKRGQLTQTVGALMEAFGDFTVQRIVNELERLHPKAHPRPWLVEKVNKALGVMRKSGQVLPLGKGQFRWKKPTQIEILPHPILSMPPTPAPPMDLTDYNQQNDYWKDKARNAKP